MTLGDLGGLPRKPVAQTCILHSTHFSFYFGIKRLIVLGNQAFQAGLKEGRRFQGKPDQQQTSIAHAGGLI